MISLEVTTVGNSLGIVLPEESLTWLKVEKGGTLYLVETTDGYLLTPHSEVFTRQVQRAEQVMRENRDVLHELADERAATPG